MTALFEVRAIGALETHPLRKRVLRPAHPRDDVPFPGDHDAHTAHFGAFADGALVGIVSLMRAPAPNEDDPRAMQLRGMATDPAVRGQRAGVALVQRCLDHAHTQGAPYVWCNARTSAEGFYRKLGFVTESDVFDVPPVGPHVIMRARLSP